MSYLKKPTRHYYPGTFDFGAGSGSYYITGPKGKKGWLVDYGVEAASEAFTNTTTGATVQVGTGSDASAYGDALDLGTLAVATGAKSVLTTYRPGVDRGYTTLMVSQEIPADTHVKVTLTAPTGGTPAGMAMPFADIIWED